MSTGEWPQAAQKRGATADRRRIRRRRSTSDNPDAWPGFDRRVASRPRQMIVSNQCDGFVAGRVPAICGAGPYTENEDEALHTKNMRDEAVVFPLPRGFTS